MFARIYVIAGLSSRWARRSGGWTSLRMVVRWTSSAKYFVSRYVACSSVLPSWRSAMMFFHPGSTPSVECNHLVHDASILTSLHIIDPSNLLSTSAVVQKFLGSNGNDCVCGIPLSSSRCNELFSTAERGPSGSRWSPSCCVQFRWCWCASKHQNGSASVDLAVTHDFALLQSARVHLHPSQAVSSPTILHTLSP